MLLLSIPLNNPLTVAFLNRLISRLITLSSSAYKPTCRFIPSELIPSVLSNSASSVCDEYNISLTPLYSAFPEILLTSSRRAKISDCIAFNDVEPYVPLPA